MKRPEKPNPDKYFLLDRLMRKGEEIDPYRQRLVKPFTAY